MTTDQAIVFSLLFGTLVLFIIGKWRYDVVAILALLVATIAGVVPADQAFSGFGHPAVVTVAAILVVSRGLLNSGLIDSIAKAMLKIGNRHTLQVAALTGLVIVCSAFMNNTGALVILLPVAVRMAGNNDRAPSYLLMPLAFGSLLGGMLTLIGTPPNIIIAAFRAETGSVPFRMFDFAPVGLGIAAVGLLFIALIGWRLIPRRRGEASTEELFQIKEYITEVKIPADSPFVGKRLQGMEEIEDSEIAVVSLVRGDYHMPAPSPIETLQAGDVVIVEADTDSLKKLLANARVELAEAKPAAETELASTEVSVMEAVVMPNSPLEGNTAWTVRLRWRYGINLLGVARYGTRLIQRIRQIQLQIGDVLLLQGRSEVLLQALPVLGCLPLRGRDLRLGEPRRIIVAVGIFATAVMATALGGFPVQITFSGAAVAMTLVRLVPLRELYQSIDWPVIVLLGAMIPVGEALETTGGAELLVSGVRPMAAYLPPTSILAIVLIGTICLSSIINNAAAAVLMAPIASSIATGLRASADPFLMAVAVGASSAFLTPIAHQSNALVMGPGGYHFGDYWRLGLPLVILTVLVAVPLIIWVWPLEAAAH
ncbi:MAG: SLC13 family permease [Deltaproteobacteria bacterium]|nr:SLC13 family permease [Deltaproteobacteria bacterium]